MLVGADNAPKSADEAVTHTHGVSMKIDFPKEAPLVYTPSTTVGFKVLVDGAEHQCEISEEALEDQFGSASVKPGDLFAAFERGRAAIESIAARKLLAQGLNGRILITNDDFRPERPSGSEATICDN